MGGREVGGLANQLAAHMGFADPAQIDRVRRFWNAPRIAGRSGLKAVDLFDKVREGGVEALWILGTNPAASMPRAARVRGALAACPFVVVSDCWPTDTTDFAEVILPAAGWGEKNGTVTNSERLISRQRPFRQPPGEARPDWWMLTEVARRMGWGAAFGYCGPADIFREHAALSGFENKGPTQRLFDISSLATLSDEEYDQLEPVQWPLPRGIARFDGTPRLFSSDTKFCTADSRARIVPTPFRPVAEPADEKRPFTLNTGRLRDQWHTMTRTGRVPRLMAHAGEPLAIIHPTDAERLGLVEGGLARIESRHGAAVLPVRLSADQRAGEVFAPMHWTDRFTSAGPIGRLVGAATDPISGQPELKATPVRMEAVTVMWRGILLRRTEVALSCGPYYWARRPLPTGHAFSLAGWKPLPTGRESEGWIANLLDVRVDAERVIYADPGRGTFRYASIFRGRLDACLLLAGDAAALPPRDAFAALIGTEIADEGRTCLLAADLRPDTGAGDPGGTVCACFSVGLRALRRAILERRLTSVAEIGAVLRAGTNCGSCTPEIAAILRNARTAAGNQA